MAVLTATQIIDQAMQSGGNTGIQAWCLKALNAILREAYRAHQWPFLITNDETLATATSQAYTSYSTLTTFWKPMIVQIRVSNALYEVTPLRGGLAAYYADTSRLISPGRPSKYVLDRGASYFRWADSIPSAIETISLTYQQDEADVALADTPKLCTHTKNGERFLLDAMDVQVRYHEGVLSEAAAQAAVAKMRENLMLAERFDDVDATPPYNLNQDYI